MCWLCDLLASSSYILKAADQYWQKQIESLLKGSCKGRYTNAAQLCSAEDVCKPSMRFLIEPNVRYLPDCVYLVEPAMARPKETIKHMASD